MFGGMGGEVAVIFQCNSEESKKLSPFCNKKDTENKKGRENPNLFQDTSKMIEKPIWVQNSHFQWKTTWIQDIFQFINF